MFEVELALGDRFGGDDMAGNVLLNCLGDTDFQVIGVQLVQISRDVVDNICVSQRLQKRMLTRCML